MKPLTAATLRELVDYDPATGIFVWRATRSRAKVGSVAGSFNYGYRRIGINGQFYFAHRLAWLHVYGEWPSGELDHINLDKADNRLVNLRLANRSLNMANSPKSSRNTSGFKGVRRCKDCDRYAAEVRVHGRTIHLGLFRTAEEAHAAYVAGARKVFDDFARAA
jgi:hypothetical protein